MAEIREWTGIDQFPAATRTKLLELLEKVKKEDVGSLTVLVMGKCGVGKSSTVNSIIGERVATVSAFQSERPTPEFISRSRSGFKLNIIDTPGLVEEGYVNHGAADLIKRFLLDKTIDVLLYVDRLDVYRVDNLDKQVIRVITDCFGKAIWQRAIIVLSHAQLSPPDGLSYDEFLAKRSEALTKVVRLGAAIQKKEFYGFPVPILLAENSGRCNLNDNGEKIIPSGEAWIPNLVETMINVASSSSSQSIFVDKKMIDGPNPNNRGKPWIPLILVFQYFFVIKGIQRAIKTDLESEKGFKETSRLISKVERKPM